MNEEQRAAWVVEQLHSRTAAPPAAVDPALQQEANAYRALWHELGNVDAPVAAESPPERLVRDFRSRLAQKRIATPWPLPRLVWVGAAAAAALVAIVFLRMLRDPGPPREPHLVTVSAATRLESVLGPSEVAVEELAAMIQREPNANVRLAAIDVLAERHGRAGLAGRLGRALAYESDPLVRVTMIRKIGEFRLGDDVQVLRVLIERPDLDPIERREAVRVLGEMAL